MDIAKLYELQKLDVNLEKARRKLAQLQQALGESEQFWGQRATQSPPQKPSCIAGTWRRRTLNWSSSLWRNRLLPKTKS